MATRNDLTFLQETFGDTIVIHLAGLLGVGQIMHMTEIFTEVRRHAPRRIILGLRGLTTLDVTGFAFLKASQLHFAGLKTQLTPVDLPSQIAESLKFDGAEWEILEQWMAAGEPLMDASWIAPDGSPVPPLPESTPRSSSRREALILVIDDEPMLLEILGITLSRSGHRVVKAESVAGAIGQLARQHQMVDLAIVDYSLETETGLVAVDLLTGLMPDLPIIMMSGMGVEKLEAVRHPNIVRFLQKPFRMDQMLAVVQEALGKANA